MERAILIVRRLLWLVKRPVRFPLNHWAMAGAVFMVLGAGALFGASDLIITKIAIGVGILAYTLAEHTEIAKRLKSRTKAGPRSANLVHVLAVSSLIPPLALITFFLVAAQTIAGAQFVMVGYYVFLAAIMAAELVLFRYDADFQAMHADVPKQGLRLQLQMFLLSMLALAALTLLGMHKLSAQAWLVWVALIPLAIHPLRAWTIIAMWPNGEDDD